jgi:hypothetical protein
MLKKTFLTTLSIVSLVAFYPAYADPDLSCKIQVAVSTPPIGGDQYVAFNVVNDYGFGESTTLRGGSQAQFIEKVPCSSAPLTISATPYTVPNGLLQSASIGQCVLKSGPVVLNSPENNVSVVFPYDFECKPMN